MLDSRNSELDRVSDLSLLPSRSGRWLSRQSCSLDQPGTPVTKTLLCWESSEKDTPGWVLQGEEAFSRLVSKAERVSAKGIVCAEAHSTACLVEAL